MPEPRSHIPPSYGSIDAACIRGLKDILGSKYLLTSPSDCLAYGYDNSCRQALPQAVALPTTSAQVAALIQLCNDSVIPLTVRGRGTNTTGATVPLHGGLVVSLEQMDRIISIDPDDRTMTVEAGITNQGVQDEAARHGLFWPPDPTSAAVCTVGGNIGCNAAGPRAVKYGTTRDNVLGLRAMSGGGLELRTGVRTSKGVVGYDLTRLIIGSEGGLAVVTEATLKLTPLAEAKQTLRAVYRDIHSAASAVASIMSQPITPCALEFMDGAALAMVREQTRGLLPDEAGALLMIEIDGTTDAIDTAREKVAASAHNEGCIELSTARTASDAGQLWAIRKKLSPILRTIAPKKINEDVVVPVSRIPRLIDGLAALGQRHRITIINFGHAGNGNIHVNLLIDPDDPRQRNAANACLKEVFELVLTLGGTLSGEHGIGLVKRDFVGLEIEPATLELMHAIKRQFDPNNILNPGKTLPDDCIEKT